MRGTSLTKTRCTINVNRLKGAVYIQMIRCSKSLCAITEAHDAVIVFWILKKMSGILISSTGNQLKCLYCFLRMFSHLLFHLELFSSHMTSITLYMCVFKCKRHLKHFHVNSVRKYFKEKREHAKHMQKKHKLIFIPVKDIQIPNIFFKIQKFTRASWASVIADKRGSLESPRKICQH